MQEVLDLLDQATSAYAEVCQGRDPERDPMFNAAIARAKAVAADSDHHLTNVIGG